MAYTLKASEKDEGRQLIAALTPLADIMTVRQGEELQLAGDGRYFLYFVLRGKVEVSYVAQNTRIIVAMIGGGNFFGEIGFFDGISRVRNMRAFEETEVLVFADETLRQLEENDPRLFIRLLLFTARSICRKFRALVEESSALPGYAATLFENRQPEGESLPLEKNFFQSSLGRRVLQQVEHFKAGLFDVSYRLQEEATPDIAPDLASRCFTVLDQLYGQLVDFVGPENNTEEAGQAWSYLFKEIFPYFMRSRFAERIYYKPKGYAGDFMLMEMIFRNEPEGDGKLGRLVDEWCLQSKGAQAIRERRRLLARALARLSAARLHQDGIRIMNLAGGSSRELFDFLGQCDYTEKIEAFCVDIDTEALHFIARAVDTFAHRAAVRLMNENAVKWSLGRVKHDLGQFDCIYAAGLADYLDDRLFTAFINRCFKHLKPGGILLLCNFAPNPDRIFMDNILKWRLVYRSADQLRGLFAESLFRGEIEIHAEADKVDNFVMATRKG